MSAEFIILPGMERKTGRRLGCSTVPAAVSVFMDRAVGMAALVWPVLPGLRYSLTTPCHREYAL